MKTYFYINKKNILSWFLLAIPFFHFEHSSNTSQLKLDQYIFIFHCLIVVYPSFCHLKRALSLKIHILYCNIKLAFLLTFHVFGSCFRMLTVIFVSDFFLYFFFMNQIIMEICKATTPWLKVKIFLSPTCHIILLWIKL